MEYSGKFNFKKALEITMDSRNILRVMRLISLQLMKMISRTVIPLHLNWVNKIIVQSQKEFASIAYVEWDCQGDCQTNERHI